MKILFVYSNKTCGCTKKYTFELARGMKKYVNTKVIYYTELTSDIVKEFDVIILQRLGTITIIDKDEVNNIIDIIEKNKNIKKFIYIMDDLVLESQNGLPIKFISHCTDVLCTSKTLAKYIRKYNDNVHVFHTFIDVESFDNIPENKNKYKNNCRKAHADYYRDDRNKMIEARRLRKKCGPLNRTNVLNYMMKKRTK